MAHRYGHRPLNVTLINPYELGRQPFGLAQPAAWLTQAGHRVTCLDLSLQRLDDGELAHAQLVAVYVAMHTATRIAVQALARIKQLAPGAHLCVYGLYAPMNEALFRQLGVQSVFGGEVEPALLALTERLADGDPGDKSAPLIELAKIPFKVPLRSGLPALHRYAHLNLSTGGTKVCGFTESSRGCKHLCRHCPVVPVYEGRFRVIPVDVILQDIANQVSAGAEHISFGDPDFLNGPGHARRVLQAVHAAFPQLSFDATVKVEHIIKHQDMLPLLHRAGCLFLTSAVESVDDDVLQRLLKGHTNADFETAAALLREHHIDMAPTFLPFHPWTTLSSYVALLERLVVLKLVHSVPPIQLAIRLLIPRGSHMLKVDGIAPYLSDFDDQTLGYPWQHPDPRVDALQHQLQGYVADAEQQHCLRQDIFEGIWHRAHEAAGLQEVPLPHDLGQIIAHMSEPWYCCAEPTNQQLLNF